MIKILDSLVWPILLAVAIWIGFFLNHGYDLGWNYFGVHPGHIIGLPGIILMPFLHGNFEHLFSNTIPLVLSMGFIVMYFQNVKWKIILAIWISTGLILWFIAKPDTNHIGASGLVYGYIAFIIAHAFINRNKQSIAAAFILIFLYGGLIYGIFPEYGALIGKNISWEGHLAGAISGVLLAFIYRRKGPQKHIYFEDEDDDDDDDPFYHQDWFDREDISFRYRYKEGNELD